MCGENVGKVAGDQRISFRLIGADPVVILSAVLQFSIAECSIIGCDFFQFLIRSVIGSRAKDLIAGNAVLRLPGDIDAASGGGFAFHAPHHRRFSVGERSLGNTK